MAEVPPPVQPPYEPGPPMQPHRGMVVFILGLVGVVCTCFAFGIVAWVLGAQDLRAMKEGRMDPSGHGLTQAGQILGIVSVGLGVLQIIAGVLWLVFAGSMVLHGQFPPRP